MSVDHLLKSKKENKKRNYQRGFASVNYVFLIKASFKDNIWSADLVDMQLTSKHNKEISFYKILLICLANINGLRLLFISFIIS